MIVVDEDELLLSSLFISVNGNSGCVTSCMTITTLGSEDELYFF